MASGPIISWQIVGEIMETVTDFISLGSKITADDDCSHEIKRHLLLGRKAVINLLLLSRLSRVRHCATPETAAHQVPPSLGFSRQEHWSGLPFPSPMRESEKWKWSRSLMSDSSDPMDCSLPGSSVHGILQAKVLEWGAIAFSMINLESVLKNRDTTSLTKVHIIKAMVVLVVYMHVRVGP